MVMVRCPLENFTKWLRVARLLLLDWEEGRPVAVLSSSEGDQAVQEAHPRECAERTKKNWASSGERAGPGLMCVRRRKGVDTLCLLGWRKGVRQVFVCEGDKII